MKSTWRLAQRILALLGALCMFVTVTPVTKWLASALAGPWNETPGDVLIVLGADEPSYGFIGIASYWRSIYAVRAWREGKFQTVVISGGNGLAESMSDFLIFEGVPPERILRENRSTSTRENALFTAALLRNMPGRKVLLTSDFHVFRSVRAFRRAGVTVEARFFPYALKRSNNWLERWPVFLDLCLESAKIARYYTKGWI